MYYEPVDVELDPRVLDQFNYDYDYESYDQVDDQPVQVEYEPEQEEEQPTISNDDQDDFESLNHYNTEDVVIINDKIKEQLANDQSLKIRKPGG